jgi:hypothetical protein
MPTLRPFRDYDEKDVLNFYSFTGPVIDSNFTILATKGTLVKIQGDGFRNDVEPIEMLGQMGAFTVNNFVAQRYGVVSKVTTAQSTDNPVGMLLFDVRELDENQLPLKYNPRKAAEMEVAISGQAVPIVTRGTFLYSGVRVSGGVAVTAGGKAYLCDKGEIATSGSTVVGKFLGTTGAGNPNAGVTGWYAASDASAIALVWLNIT